MKTQLFFCLLIFLFATACGKNKNPGLSDKELFAQKESVDTLQQTTKELKDSIGENYVIPTGIKYKESRAVDPANPPVVIDIANRKLNIKKFNLSDYYSKVRFIKIKHPMQATEGNFLFNADCQISFEKGGGIMGRWLNSIFNFTDDYIVAGDVAFGIYCYDKEGNFLYTIEANDFPKSYNASQNLISFREDDVKGFFVLNPGITAIGNNCLYLAKEDNKNKICLYDLAQRKRILTRPFETNNLLFSGRKSLLLDNNSMASYVYNAADTVSENFLFTLDLKGDTLCSFPNYNPKAEMKKNANYFMPPVPDIYYYGNQLNIRQSMNDTVYRVVATNRLLPAYVLNFGQYKLNVQTALFGDQSKNLLPSIWKEADRYVLFTYTQNRDTPNNRKDGSVKFFYSYYDKKSKQLYHFSEGTTVPEDGFLIENPIPDALPFILSYADISDNQLRVCYSKRRLADMIKNKGFASLSSEQQNKLKTMQNELGDSEVLIMILE